MMIVSSPCKVSLLLLIPCAHIGGAQSLSTGRDWPLKSAPFHPCYLAELVALSLTDLAYAGRSAGKNGSSRHCKFVTDMDRSAMYDFISLSVLMAIFHVNLG